MIWLKNNKQMEVTFLSNILSYILAILSGFLLSLPFAFPNLYLFSWIGLIPFLFFIEKEKDRADLSLLTIFLTGTIMGVIIIIISSSWLYYPLIDFSGLPWLFAIFILILVFILLGIIYGLWAVIYVFIKKSKGISPLWLAISWIAIEFLRFRFLSAFPFAFIGYTQSEFLSLLQFAEYGGVFLIGFIIILINGYLYKTIKYKKPKFFTPILLILILVFTIGMTRINSFDMEDIISVGIIQTNLDPVDKWKVSNIEKNMDYLTNESARLSDVELVVWPESSLTFDLLRNEFYRKRFFKEIEDLNSYVQIGSLSVINDHGLDKYNSSFLISPGAVIQGRYNKMKLVPFGEYMPFSVLIEKLTGISISSQMAGNEVSIFRYDDIMWKTVICSEILYPQLVSEGIKDTDFIVTQSNEAWYKRGSLQEQMWSSARYRAVENRRSILKSGNMAYGGVISPSGSIITKNHSNKLATFSAELPLNNTETFYQKWGNYVGTISTSIMLFFLIIKLILYIIYWWNNEK